MHCCAVRLFCNYLFPLQFVKVSGSRRALVGLELEVGGDEGDVGGGDKRDNVRGEEAVFVVVVVFVRVLVGIVVVIVVVVVVVFRRSGSKRSRSCSRWRSGRWRCLALSLRTSVMER